MRESWKMVLRLSIVLVGLSACRTSYPVGSPDVAALLQRRQLKLGKSSLERVVQVLGEPATRHKGLLSGKFRDGGSHTNRWVTLGYPHLGVECVIMETPAGPRLDQITLEAPYARAVLDTIYLGRQTVGYLAQALHQPIWSTTEAPHHRPYEVWGSVSVDNVELQARIQLAPATWYRCQSQKAALDSVIRGTPISHIIFSGPY